MPLYLFHGEDSYSSHQKALHWQKEFDKKYGDLNRDTIEGANFTASRFLGAIETMPFLSEKRLIIINNFLTEGKSEEIKKTAELLPKIPDHAIAVFIERKKADARTSFYKTINKIGQVSEFSLLEIPELVNWIQKKADSLKFPLTLLQAKSLAENIGSNLWQLNQEVEKLSIYSKNTAINNQTIDAMVSTNIATSIFKLTDAIGLKEAPQALKILHQLLDRNENLMQIIAMITRHFRILIEIQDGIKKNMVAAEIAKNIKQHPFVVQNGMRQIRNFSITQLKKIYRELLTIDTKIKNGSIRITTEDIRELLLAIEYLIISSVKTKD